MGMFDMLRYTQPMPNGEIMDATSDDKLWQFKEFECNLDVYDISDQGQLRMARGPRTGPAVELLKNDSWIDSDFTGELEVFGDSGFGHRLNFRQGILTSVTSNDYRG